MIVRGRVHKVAGNPAERILPPDLLEGINLGDGVVVLPRGIRKKERGDGKK